MQQLLLIKVPNCEGIPVNVSASVYTEEFPTKTAGPAFSGPILSISGIFLGLAEFLCNQHRQSVSPVTKVLILPTIRFF